MNGNADGCCLKFAEPGKRMTDEELAAEIEETFKMKAATIQSEPKGEPELHFRVHTEDGGVSTRQLLRVSGVSTGIIWALSSG
jgi:hypothetical protein